MSDHGLEPVVELGRGRGGFQREAAARPGHADRKLLADTPSTQGILPRDSVQLRLEEARNQLRISETRPVWDRIAEDG